MSTKWIWLTFGCALMGALHVAPSRAAEPAAVTGAPAPPSPVEEQASVERDPLAAALREADRRFVAGDLQGALDVLEPACDASARPECAFSLAAIHHGLGHCRDARASYRRYRELAPAGEHVEEARAALEEVETRCGDLADGASTVPARAPSGSAPPLGLPVAQTLPAVAPGVGEPGPAPPAPLTSDALGDTLVMGSLALSGAAAVTSIVFGVLAARSADRCARAEVYNRRYSEECEQRGPRYQGLWQGFALASGGFLGIGLSLWWLDAGSPAPNGVSVGGVPALRYQGRF